MVALPRPCDGPGEEVFRINAAGTFNVFQAAAEEGIRRVDEDHPGLTTDAYSFSKEIDGQIGAYFRRREGISSVTLRFLAVVSAGSGSRLVVRSAKTARLVDRLLAISLAERGCWLSERMEAFNAVRSQRL